MGRMPIFAQTGYLGKTDNDGQVTTYTYNGLGKETAERWWSGSTAVETMTYAYDAAGELISASDPNATYTYAYDGVGRSVSSTEQIAGLAATIVLTGRYNAAGYLSELSATVGGTADFVNAYEYDAAGEMTQISQTGVSDGDAVADKLVTFTYNADGQFSTITRYADLAGEDEVVAASYSYDSLGRLSVLSYTQGTTTLAGYSWSYDLQNEVTQETSVDGTTTYTYDPTGQLLTATNTTTPSLDENYTYDANGNRTSANGVTNTPTTGNQITSDGTYTYQYDNNGNLTAKVGVAGGSAAGTEIDYGWDYRNRLTSVTYKDNGSVTETIDYTYDAFNRLVGRVATFAGQSPQETVFVYDGENIALQFDGTGTSPLGANDLSHRYLWGPAVDQVMANKQLTPVAGGGYNLNAPGTVVWPLADNLGTVRDLAESSNGVTSVVNHRVINAYGDVLSQTNPTTGTAAAVDCVSVILEGTRTRTRVWFSAAPGGMIRRLAAG